jgi:hypothetical protein
LGNQRQEEYKKQRDHHVLVNHRGSKIMHYQLTLGESNAIEHAVCVNAFQNIYGIFTRAWKTLTKAAVLTDPGPIDHGNRNHRNRHEGSNAASAEEDVVDFLRQLGTEQGESYATRFIHERTSLGIQKEEDGLIELPPWYAKR